MVVLVGNKQDLINEIQVESEEGSELAKEHNYLSFLTSAKMNVGVDETLDESMKEYVDKYGVEPLLITKDHSKIEEIKDINKKKCC